ncbi:hypothetical protein [Oceanicoccus sagamiensis]|uniref:Uncharacterized protein n=1 Tax=Oceanicoccus sagamiensis TaxID=716816 RepID=A0A1X9NEV6_9GAMM|nr:hypothetical protein [Oceanicoccus sagamiensis]ARN75701.1 hypothetical protein BST96_17260 [Oceanicoccus sagamiensis]
MFALFGPQKKLLEQERELNTLRAEVETLRQQNHSMKTGMRRCVSCDYRIDYKERQKQQTITTSTQ